MTNQEPVAPSPAHLVMPAPTPQPLQLPLFGLATICCSCHRLKTTNGRWTRRKIDQQLFPKTPFSHGLCPACYRHLYPATFARRKQAAAGRAGRPTIRASRRSQGTDHPATDAACTTSLWTNL